jgi:hypothetical protein
MAATSVVLKGWAGAATYRRTWGDDALLALHRHRPLLSRLHRKAEALDSACLRALGHPHDHAVRQELLSALEWDASYHPEHARPQIRSLFKEVHDHSVVLSQHIQSGASHLAADSIASLRRSLDSLTHVLATRHKAPTKD